MKRAYNLAHTPEEFYEGVRRYGNYTTMRRCNPSLLSYGHNHGLDKNIKWASRKSRLGIPEEQLKKEVFDASRKFQSRGEFRKKDATNYCIALRRGWLDEMYWLKPQETPYVNRINYVYLYLFEPQKTFYVGVTFHGSERHHQHKKEGPVFEFAKINGVEIPEPVILEDNLDRKSEVRKQEHYWKLHYISLGYNTLNKGKTGEFSGSLGGGIRIWTRKKCYDTALLCSSTVEMNKKYPGAYNAAYRNKWLKDYTWFSPIVARVYRQKSHKRLVLQYTKDGQLVGQWDSLLIAAKYTSTTFGRTVRRVSMNIGRCCRGEGRTAYGFVWKYADEAIPA